MGSKSGTYYANARFYGADTGRFLQPDSFMPDKPMPPDLNRYSYVRNSPETFTDPTGHFLEIPIFLDFSSFYFDWTQMSAPRWHLPYLPLPADPTGPISEYHPCAKGVLSCYMGGIAVYIQR